VVFLNRDSRSESRLDSGEMDTRVDRWERDLKSGWLARWLAVGGEGLVTVHVSRSRAECDLGSLEMGAEGCSAGGCYLGRLVVSLMERGPESCGVDHWDKPHMIRYAAR
jgi:hypothetical protein